MSELIQLGKRGGGTASAGLNVLAQLPKERPEPNISANGLKYFIQTYGCQMNYSDTERVESKLESYGYRRADSFENADLVILNTCSVKQKAEDRVYGQLKNLRALKRKNKNLLVAITGCMVRQSSTRLSEKKDRLFRRSKFLDLVFRIEDVARVGELINEIDDSIIFPDLAEAELSNYFQINPKYTSKFQAFVPVGTGCDKFCTYCIVPYSRGREKSRDFKDIVEECTRLVESGVIEITLVGQTVNSYGKGALDRRSGNFTYTDDSTPFTDLLIELDKLHSKGLRRLRFTSPHPRDVHFSLMDAIANLKTLMPYIHMPLQSGNDEVLKRMNRNYRTQEYRQIIENLRAKVPDISISTDMIVGFSGETEKEFQDSLDFFREMKFEHCFLSQYSARKDTFAEKHLPDDVTAEEKRKRWHELNNTLRELSLTRMKAFEGQTVDVLFEKQEKDVYVGRSEHYKEVRVKAGRNLVGQILPVKITEIKHFDMFGELA